MGLQHWLALSLFGSAVILGIIALCWPRGRRGSTSEDPPSDSVAKAPRAAAGSTGAQPESARAARAGAALSTAHDAASIPPQILSEVMRKLQALAFGAPLAAAPDPDGIQAEVAASIRRTLAAIADKPNYAPRRPLLLPRLMQAMHDDEVSRRELARIIGTDPALAGNLLRLANSPFYRVRPEPVESLDRAIALLGLEGMRSLIAAALMQPVFRSSGGVFANFGAITWEHTLYAASAAEAHAAVLENSDPFAAQLLSLLMGLATMVLFRVATDEYLSRHMPPSSPVIASLIDTECAPLARQIAAGWQLSERIDSALADQAVADASPQSSLGRSLQAGRFLGALAVLHARHVLDEDAVKAAVEAVGPAAPAYERIWGRLRVARLDG